MEQVFALLEVKTHTRQIMTKKVSRRDHLLWYSDRLINFIACGKGVLTIYHCDCRCVLTHVK